MNHGLQDSDLRARIRAATLADETATVRALARDAGLSDELRAGISADAAELVRRVRETTSPSIMENFLAEYGLSTKEGVALMCLAEALLRVPDAETIDALIQDKISPGDWGVHLGHSSSSLVNASTWALMITGRLLAEPEESSLAGSLQGLVRRLGEPVVRTAVGQAMLELGRQFVLGRTIEEAIERGADYLEAGYTYSYDMLGEAARTESDARRYHLSYSDAITALAGSCRSGDIRENPGISVKLSALHPRYEFGQRDSVMSELAARTRSLALLAQSANMGFNIDAEEADRLDISLDVIEAVLADPALRGWDGFGVVVQAYGRRAGPVLDWLYALAGRLDRRIMVRLVKGAYWDTEIKRAQVLGLDDYPVFTAKANTDISFIANARRLLGMTDRIYPQFATHNAHTAAAILRLAASADSYEFQRLHGMGEALHDTVKQANGTRCRIYAPVGAHRDLLAYLVRRLLENGANSSFVNKIVDHRIRATDVARDPFAAADKDGELSNPRIPKPAAIFGSDRRNARGWDITDPQAVAGIEEGRARFRDHRWQAAPMIAEASAGAASVELASPADPSDIVGTVAWAGPDDIEAAISAAVAAAPGWSQAGVARRADCLERIADLYEANAPELFAIMAREAGKTLLDAVGEVREAVDFCRYYAAEARRRGDAVAGRGVFACVSPWNFPLAIFTGQIAAALVAGNAVIAKPAEQTPLIAGRAVALMHEAGVPEAVIQLLPGDGPTVGGPLTGDPRIAGVCFTGSIETAHRINRAMAATGDPAAPLIAETGGLNAMIVDSTALPEQAVRDIVASAFQSAGQRCSALRVLYVQRDVQARILEMLFGAMDALRLGDPWSLSTDIGPVIDAEAQETIAGHCAALEARGQLLKKLPATAAGRFAPPAVFRVDGIAALEREVFGPVLHVVPYEAEDLDRVVDAVNARGYGLTFGLHTRVDARVQEVVDRIRVGNIYVNRNQIGAVVGSQPFGGEGLSGTGPKAGGPHYLDRFLSPAGDPPADSVGAAPVAAFEVVQRALEGLSNAAWAGRADRAERLAEVVGGTDPALTAAVALAMEPADLPGPTGESNRLALHPRGVVLCLGPGEELALEQAVQALATGNAAFVACAGGAGIADRLAAADAPVAGVDGQVAPETLALLRGLEAVCLRLSAEAQRPYRRALAERDGAIVPLIDEAVAPARYVLERHLCIDTTAAGGNASLLSASQ